MGDTAGQQHTKGVPFSCRRRYVYTEGEPPLRRLAELAELLRLK